MKKRFAFLLAMIIIASCALFSIGAFANEIVENTSTDEINDESVDLAAREAAASKWDGTVYTAGGHVLEGEGTEESPYLLNNADDVAKFAANVNYGENYKGKYIKLTCDLDFQNQAWNGIGGGTAPNADNSNGFQGTFDGDYHVIYNFNMLNKSYTGFFGVVINATVKNIGIAGGSVSLSVTRSGPLIGFAKLNLYVSKCFNNADVNYTGQGWIGGLIGTVMNDGKCTHELVDCYNSGDISLSNPLPGNYNVGGLVGYLSDGTNTLTNCYNIGNVTVTAHNASIPENAVAGYAVGGLVGSHAWQGTYIYDSCGSYGAVAYNNDSVSDIKDVANVGLMVGFLHTNGAFSMGKTNSYIQSGILPVTGSVNAASNAVAVEAYELDMMDAYFLNSKKLVAEVKSDYEPVDEADRMRYEAASKWDGTIYEVTSLEEVHSFAGSGTKEDPYLLNSADDVAKLAGNVRFSHNDTLYVNKYFKLTCDVDLQHQEWLGIGGCFSSTAWDDKAMFCGIFLGDNHVIYNFNLADTVTYINSEGMKVTGAVTANGFFGYVGFCKIYDLGIANGEVELDAASRSGAFIGASRYELTVSNCFNRADMTFNFVGKGMPQVGGLIGCAMNDGTTKRLIENCYNSGDITVNVSGLKIHTVGGIAGYLSEGIGTTLHHCYNTGNITVNADHGKLEKAHYCQGGIGSLVGSHAFNGKYIYEYCGAGGVLNYNNPSSGEAFIGSFAGFIRAEATVTFADGNVYASSLNSPVIGSMSNDEESAPTVQPVNVVAVDTVEIPMEAGEYYFMMPVAVEDGSGEDDENNLGNDQGNGGGSNGGNSDQTTDNGISLPPPAVDDGDDTVAASDDTSAKKSGGCGSTLSNRATLLGLGLVALMAMGLIAVRKQEHS